MRQFYFLVGILCLCLSCSSNQHADLVIMNGNIHTVSTDTPKATSLAVKNGKIIALGEQVDMETYLGEETKTIDAQGKFVMPGLIEGHGHFSGMGKSLVNINLLDTKSWEEVIERVAAKAKTLQKGEWIEGRGWHQEKWDSIPLQNVHGYPFHDRLSELTKDNPIILKHASGHSLFANKAAMDISKVSIETGNPAGGEIVRDKDGYALGVFEERAMQLIQNSYDEYLEGIPEEKKYALWLEGIEKAQEKCLANGITSFQDAGSTFKEIEYYKSLADNGDLDIRLWAMIRHRYEDMKGKLSQFPIIERGNGFFTVRAIKSEIDGALGAFGAWLLKPYNDKPSFEGQNTTPITEVSSIAKLAKEHDLQLCVHGIGDRANRLILDLFEEYMPEKGYENGSRWRVEHAQHLHPKDIKRFHELGAIASMQAIHCTSDSPFVEKRLGHQRSKEGAYAWRSLLDSGARLANGTDVPVEDISPIDCIYAAVTRKRKDTGFEFYTEQKMTRTEAIKSYTLDNAFAAFEEDQKGSLEIGKLADIVILSNDLLSCTDEEILETKVLYTIVDGEIKYQANK